MTMNSDQEIGARDYSCRRNKPMTKSAGKEKMGEKKAGLEPAKNHTLRG
ncbi:hypothetical protein [Paraburkholderia sp. J63]|nr:hypothetical protein [Paraburkholderia sp. J63]